MCECFAVQKTRKHHKKLAVVVVVVVVVLMRFEGCGSAATFWFPPSSSEFATSMSA
jgi:hypothetical protein